MQCLCVQLTLYTRLSADGEGPVIGEVSSRLPAAEGGSLRRGQRMCVRGRQPLHPRLCRAPVTGSFSWVTCHSRCALRRAKRPRRALALRTRPDGKASTNCAVGAALRSVSFQTMLHYSAAKHFERPVHTVCRRRTHGDCEGACHARSARRRAPTICVPARRLLCDRLEQTNAPHVWLPAFSCSLCCFCNDGLVVWQRHSLVSALQRRLGKMTATKWLLHFMPPTSRLPNTERKTPAPGPSPTLCSKQSSGWSFKASAPPSMGRQAQGMGGQLRAGSWRASSGSGGGV